MDDILKNCGGKKVNFGLGKEWYFGYKTPSVRHLNTVPHQANEDAPEIKGDKVFLWEFAKAANKGKMPAYNWQLTGSCVNGGAQNMLITRTAIEVCCLPQPEKFVIPFTLFSYGQSRWHGFRDDSEGEGSLGSEMKWALENIGVMDINDFKLPRPTISGPCFFYTRATEFKYSSIRNHPSDLIEKCKKHKLKGIAINSLDELERELRRGRPATFAGDWGGSMQCRIEGSPGVILNRRNETWNHQQSIQGMWLHPSLGRIFYCLNQWYMKDGSTYVSVHGKPTQGEPEGGYWMLEKDVEYQIRTGEVICFTGYEGFTEESLGFGGV